MTYSFQNLQDFVLNLLNDEAARSAYAADPAAALSDAGLGDLTPQDVQEVIPLVTDALPSETPLGDVAVDVTGVMDGTDSLGGSVGVTSDLGEVGGWGVRTDDGVAVWGGGATDLLGRVAGGVAVEGDGVAVAATTPLGYVDVDTAAQYTFVPADPTDVAQNLGHTGDAVAGTVTHVLGNGADTLAGVVDSGGDTLAGFLAGTPAAPAAGVVETGTDMVAGGIAQGAHTLADHAHVPTAGDLPTPGDLPEVPGLGGLPVQLPSLDSLPVVGGLPVDLPVDLPVPPAAPSLPAGDLGMPMDGPSANTADVLAHNPVTDAVSASPVGGLTDTVHGVTSHLPVGDVTDQLDLGL